MRLDCTGSTTHGISNTTKVAEKFLQKRKKKVSGFALLCFEPIAWEKCVLYHLADPFGLARTAAGPKSKYEGKMFHHLE